MVLWDQPVVQSGTVSNTYIHDVWSPLYTSSMMFLDDVVFVVQTLLIARSTEVNGFYHEANNSHGTGYNDAAVHEKVATAATILSDVLPR